MRSFVNPKNNHNPVYISTILPEKLSHPDQLASKLEGDLHRFILMSGIYNAKS